MRNQTKKPLVIHLVGGRVDTGPSSVPSIHSVGGVYQTSQIIDKRIKMLNKYTVRFVSHPAPTLWQRQNEAQMEPSHTLREILPQGMAWNRLHHLRRSPR